MTQAYNNIIAKELCQTRANVATSEVPNYFILMILVYYFIMQTNSRNYKN